jgi:hypothetical protein
MIFMGALFETIDPNVIVAGANALLVVVTFILVVVTRMSARDAARAANAAETATGLAADGLALASGSAKAESLLRVEEILQHDRFANVHARLLPWGDLGSQNDRIWDESDSSIWSEVIPYMGMFERVNTLVDIGLLEREWVANFYGYRIALLVNQASVRQRLHDFGATGWVGFIALWHTIERLESGQHSRGDIPCATCEKEARATSSSSHQDEAMQTA